MPRVTITAQELSRAGLNPTETTGDATNNHQFKYENGVYIQARNAHATLARLLTLRLAKTVDGQTPPNRTVSIPAVSTRLVGPFTEDYRQTDDFIYIDVETVDLFLAIIRLVPGR